MFKVKDMSEIERQKAENAAREERARETAVETSIPSAEHGIVPIPGRLTLL